MDLSSTTTMNEVARDTLGGVASSTDNTYDRDRNWYDLRDNEHDDEEEASFVDIPEPASDNFFQGSLQFGSDLSILWNSLADLGRPGTSEDLDEADEEDEEDGELEEATPEEAGNTSADDASTTSFLRRPMHSPSFRNNRARQFQESTGKNRIKYAARKSIKKRKRVVQKRSCDMPKRPLSAYNLYFQAERVKMLKLCQKESGNNKSNPNPSFAMPSFRDFGRMIGKQWRALDQKEKQRFERLAEQDGDRYHYELQAYHQRKKIQRKRLLELEDACQNLSTVPTTTGFQTGAPSDYSDVSRLELRPTLSQYHGSDQRENSAPAIKSLTPPAPSSPHQPTTPSASPLPTMTESRRHRRAAVEISPPACPPDVGHPHHHFLKSASRLSPAISRRNLGSNYHDFAQESIGRHPQSQRTCHDDSTDPVTTTMSIPTTSGPHHPSPGPLVVVTPPSEKMTHPVANIAKCSRAMPQDVRPTIDVMEKPTVIRGSNHTFLGNSKAVGNENSLPMPPGMTVTLENPRTGMPQRYKMHYKCYSLPRQEADSFVEQFQAAIQSKFL